MSKIKSTTVHEATQPTHVMFGVFNVSEFRVPFMSAILSIRQISEWFSLVTDDPKYAQQDWDVQELFQREVSIERARSIASSYLSTTSARPQFFNSLTVVLSPKPTGEAPTIDEDDKYKHSIEIGPISLSFDKKEKGTEFPAGGSPGVISWNRDSVSAVAIDGQHRLAALKEFLKENPSCPNHAWISVILLIFDKKFGYVEPSGKQVDPLKAMRSIFIDLNKHAVSVSRARNILLDDHDPAARFVRTLFSNNLGTKFDNNIPLNEYGLEVGASNEFKCRLPLNLVDWHSESKSKIDKGPYVASILSLDWIVQKILQLKNLKTPLVPGVFNPDSDDDTDPYADLSAMLKKGWPITWSKVELQLEQRINLAKITEQPFLLGADDIDSLADEFEKKWGRAITRMLTGLPGYRAVSKLRSKTLTPNFGQWFQALEAYEAAAEGPIKQHYKIRLDAIVKGFDAKGLIAAGHREVIEKIEKEKEQNVLFFLVGQRAVFLTMFSLVETHKGPNWFPEVKAKAKTQLSIGDFNNCWTDFYAVMVVESLFELFEKDKTLFSRGKKISLSSKGLDKVSALNAGTTFWAASLVRREDPEQMDFSGKAADRGARVLLVAVYLYWWMKVNAYADAGTALGALWKLLDQKTVSTDIFAEELRSAVKAFFGKDDIATVDYHSPMHFLTKQVTDWKQSYAEGSGKARIEALVEAYCAQGEIK